MAGPALVLDPYLLANHGHAHVFYQEPGDFKTGDDVDRVHLPGPGNVAHALGSRGTNNVRRGRTQQRNSTAGRQ